MRSPLVTPERLLIWEFLPIFLTPISQPCVGGWTNSPNNAMYTHEKNSKQETQHATAHFSRQKDYWIVLLCRAVVLDSLHTFQNDTINSNWATSKWWSSEEEARHSVSWWWWENYMREKGRRVKNFVDFSTWICSSSTTTTTCCNHETCFQASASLPKLAVKWMHTEAETEYWL